MKEDGIYGQHTAKAKDPKNGMTLDELDEFVQAARAKRIAGGSKVEMWSTWRQSAKTLRVEGHVIPDGEGQANEKRGSRPKLPRTNGTEDDDRAAGTP